MSARFGAQELEQAGFGILGAYLLILALRDLAVVIYVLRMKAEWDSTGQFTYLWANNGQTLIGAVVQGLFAVILLLGRQRLASAWSKLHPMGDLGASEDSEDTTA